MREFDDNPHSYGPVLRRIGILVAVIVAVPVMLWVITSFMRTYVAQPVIASPKPLLAPVTTASINTGSINRPAGSTDTSAPVQTANPVNDSNAPSPAARFASATPAMTPDPQPSAANGPWPDPNQAIGGPSAGTQQAAAPDPAPQSATSDDAQLQTLPPAPPLTGPIPLPPHRPAILAMAASGTAVTGAVPLPRSRPADAGAPAEATSDGGSNFLTHLFGQTH